jgi:raffinose/stachyose/melibiose transport system substrate-binding protein
MKRRINRRRFLQGSAGITVGAFLAACGAGEVPGSNTPASSAGASPAGGAATQAPAGSTGKTQLLLWDGVVEDTAKMDRLVAQFNQAHPDIEVRREAQATEQIRNVLRTALDAGQGPDIVSYDTGPGFAGVLAKAGLLLPLDDAYAKYGWNERLYPIAKQRTTFDGKAYGIGNDLEVVGVFYNKRIFQEQGLSEPKTHEELLQMAEKLKAAGLIPIAFADQSKWPAGHTFSIFAGNIAGREKLAQAISGEVAWNDPDFVRAIQTAFVDMNKAGYFIPEVNAVNYDDWQALFYAGKAAMSLTGTWQVANYSKPENMTDPVGFFLYPPIDGKPIAPPSGLGNGYFISSKTKNPEAATQFLDFLFSKETAKFWIEELSRIPSIQINPADYKVSELMRFTLDTLQKGADTMGYNIDVLTPDNFNTVMGDGFQEVLAGTKTAQQQADDLQQAMVAAKAEGKTFDITP